MFGHPRPHVTRIRPGWVIFVTLFLTYGYFFSEPSWNGRSRMDLVRALVEDHTTRIDRFHENTGDKSYFEGHYYSDKAPGASFLAVPAYAAYFGWLKARVGEAAARNRADEFEYKGLYLSTLAAVAFPSAAAVTLFFVVATRLVENRTKALFASAAFGLGTLAFPYSTVLFGHQLSGALLFVSFGLLVLERQRVRSSSLAWRRWPMVLSGLAGAGAVVAEFPAAVPLVLIGLYATWVVPNRRAVLPFVWSTLPPLALLMTYNWASFGSPWALGYSHLALPKFAEAMSEGFFGHTYPKPAVLLELLFGFSRGLLPLSPVLILSLVGVRQLSGRQILRPELSLCVGIIAFFLLLNASYADWTGGYALGPRHVVPMLPFLSLFMLFGLGDKLLLPSLLLAVSIGNMLAGAALSPIVPSTYTNALFDYLYPRLFADSRAVAWNWGTITLGLRGVWSLVPLVTLWLVSATLLLLQGAQIRRRRVPRGDRLVAEIRFREPVGGSQSPELDPGRYPTARQ